MHPIVKSFLDNLSLPNSTTSVLSSLGEIRESHVISLVSKPEYLGLLNFRFPLTKIFALVEPQAQVDLYYDCRQKYQDSEYALYRFLQQRCRQYNLMCNSHCEKGYLLGIGANELVLGEHCALNCWNETISQGQQKIGYSEIAYYQKHFPDERLFDFVPSTEAVPLLVKKQNEEQKLRQIMAGTSHQSNIDALLDLYFDHPADELALERYELSEQGLNVNNAEASGVVGSLNELERRYLELLQITTLIEGRHTPQPASDGSVNMDEAYTFSSKAEIIAIVEDKNRRFLCFHMADLPPDKRTELVWVEK